MLPTPVRVKQQGGRLGDVSLDLLFLHTHPMVTYTVRNHCNQTETFFEKKDFTVRPTTVCSFFQGDLCSLTLLEESNLKLWLLSTNHCTAGPTSVSAKRQTNKPASIVFLMYYFMLLPPFPPVAGRNGDKVMWWHILSSGP